MSMLCLAVLLGSQTHYSDEKVKFSNIFKSSWALETAEVYITKLRGSQLMGKPPLIPFT